ncbi:MAG: PDDEXK-like family protein [Cecembia sp.]
MNETPTEKDFLNLLNDASFERIELELQSANFFDILNATKSEVRHSNFLAWILDPNANHGLNEMILLRFLRDIFSSERVVGLYGPEADTLDFRSAEVRREWQNIDLLIVFKEVVIVIENKWDSSEHSSQLTKYRKAVEAHFPDHKKAYVLLTKEGTEAKSEEDKNHYIEYNYIQIAQILERIMTVYKPQINDRTYLYLEDYLKVLKRNIMQEDHLNELAVKLYQTHRTALNFIFENKPDLLKEIQKLFIEVIKDSSYILGSTSKSYVRFLTKDLSAISTSHSQSNGWINKEVFLFEFVISATDKDVRIVFKPVISPGDNPLRDEYAKSISTVEGASRPYGKLWLVHFIQNKKFSREKFEELSDEERKEELKKFLDTCRPIVEKVEKAILANPEINKV